MMSSRHIDESRTTDAAMRVLGAEMIIVRLRGEPVTRGGEQADMPARFEPLLPPPQGVARGEMRFRARA